jgi:hypothetical protein
MSKLQASESYLQQCSELLRRKSRFVYTSLRRRWKYKKSNHEEIILRDVMEKIIVWVDKFKEIGDNVVVYDPAHAALPWAGVRFLLQVSSFLQY